MRAYLFALILAFSTLSTAAQEIYSSRLWEIKHPDLQYTSYLVGTVHSGNEGLFAINDSLYWAIEQSDLVAFEIEEEKNERDYPGTMNKMSAATRDIGFLTMECVMELLPKYEDMNTDTLVNRYIAGITAFYEAGVQDKRGPELRSMVFDDFLTAYARFKGKKVDGIEDVQEQIKALYTYTKPQLRSIVESYFTGDDHMFSKISGDSVILMAAENRYENICKMYTDFSYDKVWGSYFKKLLDDRNIQMVDYVLEHSKEEPMLCAVGLAHMCGPLGVIALLQKEGYTIRPIQIYNEYKRDRTIVWHEFENKDLKTVLPKGVDSIIKKNYYNSGIGGFVSTQVSKNQNVLITPEGAVWFEYKGKGYEYYDEEEVDEDEEEGAGSNDLEESLSAYINGKENDGDRKKEEVLSEAVEAAMQAVEEALTSMEDEAEEVTEAVARAEDEDEEDTEKEIAIAMDGSKLTDSLINSLIDSIASRVLGDVDLLDLSGGKKYPTKFVEFWSKVNDGKRQSYSYMIDDEDEDDADDPKIDTLSLGEGLGNYTVQYKDDVIFEYKMPGDNEITLRMRGDEIVMKRPEFLDYFRKAVLKEKD